MQVTALRFQTAGFLGWLLALANRNKAIFLLVGTLLIGAAFFHFANEYPLYMFTGFLGGWSVLRLQDKAWIRTDAEGYALIESRLEASGFIKDGALGCWRPSLPKLLRWHDTAVRLTDDGNNKPFRYHISGPYIVLRQLMRGIPQSK